MKIILKYGLPELHWSVFFFKYILTVFIFMVSEVKKYFLSELMSLLQEGEIHFKR